MFTSADCDAFAMLNKYRFVFTLSTHNSASPRRISPQLPLHQPLRIPDIDLPPRRIVDVELLDHLDGRRDRAERRVGREHHVGGAEEVEATRNAVLAAEHGGIAVELLEIVEMRPPERRQNLRIVLAGGAGAE